MDYQRNKWLGVRLGNSANEGENQYEIYTTMVGHMETNRYYQIG